MAKIAENAVIQDGIMYKPGEKIPDLGNWTCVKIESGRRYYEGVSKEISLLPTYVDHGSRAVCLDTSEIYVFHAKLKKWFKLG
jgi:hypothetical protein